MKSKLTRIAAAVVLATCIGCNSLRDLPAGPTFSTQVQLEPAGAQKLADVQDVRAHLSITGAPAGSSVVAEFAAPDGSSFQTVTTSLPADATGPQSVDAVLPVGGTVVQLGGVTGTWNVRWLVNGTALTVQSFELAP